VSAWENSQRVRVLSSPSQRRRCSSAAYDPLECTCATRRPPPAAPRPHRQPPAATRGCLPVTGPLFAVPGGSGSHSYPDCVFRHFRYRRVVELGHGPQPPPGHTRGSPKRLRVPSAGTRESGVKFAILRVMGRDSFEDPRVRLDEVTHPHHFGCDCRLQ
jgi:hypothetical protein